MTAREQAETNAILNNSMPDTNNARTGFDAGWRSRNAEVESLTAQLQAAQATVEAALAVRVRKEGVAGAMQVSADMHAILSRADTSALAAVKAEALREAADEFEKRDDTFGWDELHRMSEWLRARAASIEQAKS